MNPSILGVIGPGFLNQVPTLGFMGAAIYNLGLVSLRASGCSSSGCSQWSGYRWASLFRLWGGCGVWGLGFTVKQYKASSRQGLMEDMGRRFVRVNGLCSALSLDPVFHVGPVF